MLKLLQVLTSGVTGEVSPKLEGRVDLSKFGASFRKLENFYIYPQGPYTKREGTYYANEAKYRDKKCRLIPFIFSVEQAYMLEFGDYYIRFYMDGGAIAETAKNITGATKDNPVVITSVAHGYETGDEIYIDEVVGMTELNGKWYRIVKDGADAYHLHDLAGDNVDGSGYTTYTSGGKSYRRYEITTPYSEDDLFGIQYSQSADIMYIAYGGIPELELSAIPVYKLSRTDHTSWTIEAVNFIDGPYLPAVTLRNGVTPSAVSGDITLTAVQKTITGATKANPVVITSASHGYLNGDIIYITAVVGMTEINDRWFVVTNKAVSTYQLYDLDGNKVDGTDYTAYTSGGKSQDILFSEADINRLIRFKCAGSVYRYAKITAYTSGILVSATVKKTALPSVAIIKEYRRGYWSDDLGYPYAVSFHEQRLVFGGCYEYPNTIWGSMAGSDSFENFTPGNLDGDPIVYTIASDQVNAIKWLSSGTFLSMGTGDGEFSLKTNTLNEPLSPTNIKADRESTCGCAYMMPAKIGKSAFFVQAMRRKLFEFAYRYTEEGDTFATTDLMILAEHITKSGIVDMAYQKEPNSILWCVLGDGTLIGMTYIKEHDVIGWHRHDVGGVVESIGCIPGSSHTELWLSVKRTIDSIERRYIEYFNPTNYEDNIEDAFFVDCGLTYDDDPTDTIMGLGHLEGKEIAILADGSVHPVKTVTNGQIILDQEASVIHIGLPYTATADYQRAEPQLQSGTIAGKKKRITGLMIRVLNSLGCKVGADDQHLGTVRFARGTMGEPSPLFSGDKFIQPPSGYSTDGKFTIVSDEPLPLTIVSIVPTYTVGEE